MADTLVHLTRGDDGVALVELEHGKANTLSAELLAQLHAVATELAEQPPGAVVVTGRGRMFAAGAEISEFGGPDEARDVGAAFHRALDAVAAIPRLVVAAVNGFALGGGCELALACDLRIAGDRASFAQSFVKVGLAPDWGGTWFLPRIVGMARAQELMWTGRRVEAEEALALGLAHELVPAAQLRARVAELAARLADAPATSLHMIKLAMQTTLTQDLEGMLEFEAEAQARCWDSPDSTEGLRAFAQKRPARFG